MKTDLFSQNQALVFGFVGSALVHFGISYAMSQSRTPTELIQQPVQLLVQTQTPPPPPPQKENPTPPPEVVTPPPPQKTSPIRPDARAKPQPPSAKPPEVRGGLSDSTVANGTGLAVAEGNSAVAGVDPEAARKPPPPPVSDTSLPQAAGTPSPPRVYGEASVEVPPRCGMLPPMDLSEDAVAAGVTAGEIVVRVVLDESGRVIEAKLIKGTGYSIDKTVLANVKSTTCTAAQVGGKSVRVRRDFVVKIQY